MNRFRLFALALGSIIFGSMPFTAHSATIPDEQFSYKVNPPWQDGVGYKTFTDGEFRMAISVFEEYEWIDGRAQNIHQCGKPESKCIPLGQKSDKQVVKIYEALLGGCENDTSVNCVESLNVMKEGKTYKGKILNTWKSNNPQSYAGDPKYNLPTGGNSFLVDIPEVPHNGGSKYLVVAKLNGEKRPEEEKFGAPSLSIAIFAVNLKSMGGNYIPTSTWTDLYYSGGGLGVEPSLGRNHPHFDECIQTSVTECAVPYTLPLDAQFDLSIKLQTKTNGWFHGKMKDAQITLITDSNDIQKIKISAKPVKTPQFAKFFLKNELTPELIKFYSSFPAFPQLAWAGQKTCLELVAAGYPPCTRDMYDLNERNLSEFLLWVKQFNDRGTFAPTQWTISTIGTAQKLNDNCYKNTSRVSGIQMTDATSYINSPPEFNKDTQTLDYKVAAPHFLPDGEVFRGSYELFLNSEVARCLYGFSSAPVSATISIVSSEGTEQSALTSVEEKDGWLHLKSQGFTFSSPTVRIKLTQEQKTAAVAASVEKTSTVVVSKPALKTSITCIKGKTAKKISGTNPKCPVGYKNK